MNTVRSAHKRTPLPQTTQQVRLAALGCFRVSTSTVPDPAHEHGSRRSQTHRSPVRLRDGGLPSVLCDRRFLISRWGYGNG